MISSQVEDPSTAADANVRAAFLDGANITEEQCGFDDVCPMLAQYLISHPQALISNKRKRYKSGDKRYFGEQRSEDVMAEKVVSGCWACGRHDHDCGQCQFKRCFICSELGHEQVQCMNLPHWCKNCKQQGHREPFCPDNEYCQGLHAFDDVAFCRCVSCGMDGHVQCGEVARISAVTRSLQASASRWSSPVVLRPGPRNAFMLQSGPHPPKHPPWLERERAVPSKSPALVELPRIQPWPGLRSTREANDQHKWGSVGWSRWGRQGRWGSQNTNTSPPCEWSKRGRKNPALWWDSPRPWKRSGNTVSGRGGNSLSVQWRGV